MTKEKTKKSWIPESKEGKRALIFSSLAVIWGILMPIIPFSEWMRNNFFWGILFGGPPRILLFFAISIFGARYLHRAIFKVKDRAILVMIMFVLFCLISAFWIMFFIGELLFPH